MSKYVWDAQSGGSKTATKSLWLNRICERHTGVLEESITNITDDVSCDLKTAASWAVSAKNNLHWLNGYRQTFLLFGRNLNYQTVINSNPHTLKKKASSVTTENNLKALHKATEAFIIT